MWFRFGDRAAAGTMAVQLQPQRLDLDLGREL